RQLIVSGNVLLHIPENGPSQVFRLDSYVVKRDWNGNVLEIVLEQTVAHESLSAEARELVQNETPSAPGTSKTGAKSTPTVDLYTYVYRQDDKFYVFQEVCVLVIESTKGSYPLDRCPWLALRLSAIHGEDYGRGYVEELLGDLI